MSNDVTCKVCRKPGGLFPDGWYQVSVNDPHAPNGRYRYLGVFCSVVCLAQFLPEMSRVETEIQRRAERGG